MRIGEVWKAKGMGIFNSSRPLELSDRPETSRHDVHKGHDIDQPMPS